MSKQHLKPEAIRLRIEEKLSLDKISEKLGIAKSTASSWLKDYPLDKTIGLERRMEWIKSEEGQRHYQRMREFLSKKTLPFEELKSWGAIKRRIFRERGRRCESCGWDKENSYNGIVPVQIHHINGDGNDHSRENLIVLCPNCHSLTDSFMNYGNKWENGKPIRKSVRTERIGKYKT